VAACFAWQDEKPKVEECKPDEYVRVTFKSGAGVCEPGASMIKPESQRAPSSSAGAEGRVATGGGG
jgi:hypothetical protein